MSLQNAPSPLQERQPGALFEIPRKQLYECVFSPCGLYRYVLRNVWDKSKPLLAVIGLNPSRADQYKLDMTVNRVSRWAKAWGYGGIIMLNLFAFRSPHPKVMKATQEPVGADNDRWIRSQCSTAAKILCVWGNDGSYLNRAQMVIDILNGPLAPFPRELHCLGLTSKGFPTHPAARGKHRLPDNIQPQLFRGVTT